MIYTCYNEPTHSTADVDLSCFWFGLLQRTFQYFEKSIPTVGPSRTAGQQPLCQVWLVQKLSGPDTPETSVVGLWPSVWRGWSNTRAESQMCDASKDLAGTWENSKGRGSRRGGTEAERWGRALLRRWSEISLPGQVLMPSLTYP